MLVQGLLYLSLVGFAQAATPTSYRAIPTLNASIDAAPSLVPNIFDPTAPDSQLVCPGYKASNLKMTSNGMTGTLTLAGPACNTYGNDIQELSMSLTYQSKSRINLEIIPAYLSHKNYTKYILRPEIVTKPEFEGSVNMGDTDLVFHYQNQPSFQFQVIRRSNGDVIFSTYGTKIVFQDQFLELATSMVPDYNLYGLAEVIHEFRLGNNLTRTFYAADSGNPIDLNLYGTHPWYMETRYGEHETLSHAFYARNSHAQEWLLRERNVTYRTIGGSFDLYFYSGPSAENVISQFQLSAAGLPAMQQYWTLGFHQCRWGYTNWSNLEYVVENYAKAGIQLECIWNDIDYMDQYRDFTNSPEAYPVDLGQEFLRYLHDRGQHYVPIIDSAIYIPNPNNASDAYASYSRGSAVNAFVHNPDASEYIGTSWPGFTVFLDWFANNTQQYWVDEIVRWYKDIQFDGIWIDLSEVSSFCVGSCGTGQLDLNPAHPPFKLPGDPGNVDYRYPDGFNVTNATEFAAAEASSASQAASISSVAAAMSTVLASTASDIVTSASSSDVPFMRTKPTPGVRNLDFPPYVINNVFEGHALEKNSIAPNATHSDAYNTTEYEYHNLYGSGILNATYHALLKVFPEKRPFIIGRSTFVGAGIWAGHWGGDNLSNWYSMYISISQAFQFAMTGFPMFGADTCGFAGNTDEELCSRWMQMSAFFPFYRNHNLISTISQEAYVWEGVASATRTTMQIRFQLLPYMYTLFHYAATKGETVMRALAWEFPTQKILAKVDTQFMLGPSILVTPVLVPLVDTVKGVFPGSPHTLWYDWYSLQPVQSKADENVTLAAPLGHINVHVKGGSVLALQQPGNNTATSRHNPWNLLITLDKRGTASGKLYLDDGESLKQKESLLASFKFEGGVFTYSKQGSYSADTNKLSSVTIAGIASQPSSVTIGGKSIPESCHAYEKGTLRLTGLDSYFPNGVWRSPFTMTLH